jgi:hypothetical protein
MKGILLTHYYHKDFEPLKSILSDTETGNETVNRLSQLPEKAFKRFKNYEWYTVQRRGTEEWLYNRFVAMGGVPKVLNPIYFVLGDSEYLRTCYGENVRVLQIGLDEISEKEISFTLSDSMAIQVSGAEKNVLTKKALFEYIENQGVTLIDYINSLDEGHQYIEAQLWSDCIWILEEVNAVK